MDSYWFYIVPAAFLGLLGMLYQYQHKLIYYPDVPPGHRTHMLPPSEFNLPEPESVFLPMRDGVRVHVWVFRHGDSRQRATVIFYHGNAGNISFRNDNFRALFWDCGVNVVAVEYRGFGLSEGTPNEPELRSDALEVFDWLRSQNDTLDVDRLVLLGRSIGGAVALSVCEHRQQQVAALVLENTFTSVGELVDALMPHLRYFKFLLTNPWENARVAPLLRELPCMFIMSGKDELIPPYMMPKLRDLYAGPKEWVVFPAAQHMNAHTFPGYNRQMKAFIDRHASKK